jgi:hypothetical protein
MRRDEVLVQQEEIIRALSGEGRFVGVDVGSVAFVRDLARAKRLAKIESVLPRTCRALGGEYARLGADFAGATPPTSFRSRADALAFYLFLRRRRVAAALIELAYCELALSAVEGRVSEERPRAADQSTGAATIRRAPGVRLRRCRFNVRPCFEEHGTDLPLPLPAPIHLAIVADPPEGAPRIAQLSQGLFDLLRRLRTWNALPWPADEETTQLLSQLQRGGLLEIASNPC